MKKSLINNTQWVPPILRNCDHSKSVFCIKIAKVNISMLKTFVQQIFWSFKKLSPNSHNEQKINQISSEIPIFTFSNCNSSKLNFCTELSKMNISMVKIFTQKHFWTFKATFL